MGAGILPPLPTNTDGRPILISIMGASPRSPPKETESPGFLPYAGMRRTAVVLVLTTPIEISSAMMPLIMAIREPELGRAMFQQLVADQIVNLFT